VAHGPSATSLALLENNNRSANFWKNDDRLPMSD
jgi:hypothetical protein